jgi:hypothetical protein
MLCNGKSCNAPVLHCSRTFNCGYSSPATKLNTRAPATQAIDHALRLLSGLKIPSHVVLDTDPQRSVPHPICTFRPICRAIGTAPCIPNVTNTLAAPKEAVSSVLDSTTAPHSMAAWLHVRTAYRMRPCSTQCALHRKFSSC